MTTTSLVERPVALDYDTTSDEAWERIAQQNRPAPTVSPDGQLPDGDKYRALLVDDSPYDTLDTGAAGLSLKEMWRHPGQLSDQILDFGASPSDLSDMNWPAPPAIEAEINRDVIADAERARLAVATDYDNEPGVIPVQDYLAPFRELSLRNLKIEPL